MYNNYKHRKGSQSCLINGTLFISILALLLPAVEAGHKAYKLARESRTPEYQQLMQQAEPIADKLYGNSDRILSDSERKIWYESISSQPIPNTEELRTFVNLGKSLEDKF